jgi:alkanesulfonate monooxygenase
VILAMPAGRNEERHRMRPLRLFATSPQSLGADAATYKQNVIDVARWSERAGCAGILVYTDNSIVDPWLVSQVIVENTSTLAPLVAVQPVYMHPYTVAKLVTSIAFLHGRRIFLNMVAGGFTNDLAALADRTPHDRRYARVVEYVNIITGLLNGAAVTTAGEFYSVDKLHLRPPLPRELFPGILMSGSSEAGLAAAQAVGATAVRYPGPSADYIEAPTDGGEMGIRVGIIAREDEDTAWRVAHERFPVDRKGQLTHELAMKVSDSAWHKQLSTMDAADGSGPYWLIPFKNFKTNCPYLVGSYETVAAELKRYTTAGFTTYILDIPPTEEELHHIGIVFERATASATVGMRA